MLDKQFPALRADRRGKQKNVVQKDGALIYCRVSTKEQQNNLSLPVQEKACRDFCAKNGWKVLQVYKDAESAKTINRTHFREMLEYCAGHHKLIAAVVFYDTSRFSRETGDYHKVRMLLKARGIDTRAATQPFDNSPSGELTESMLAAFATFDNRIRIDKTIKGMQEAQRTGHWAHRAPLGYRNVPNARKDEPNLIRDTERAPLIKKAFELFASGQSTKAHILQSVTKLGLKDRSGKGLSQQTFDKLLRNPVYAGWIVSESWGIKQRDLFEPIVEEDLFERAQAAFVSRGSKARSRVNGDFPLRVFARCEACGKGLTGSFSTSRSKKRHPYYFCRTSGCRAVTFQRDILHHEFHQLLYSLVPDRNFMLLFREVVIDAWKQKHAHQQERLSRAEKQIAELETQSQKLLDLLLRGTVDEKTYQMGMERVGTGLEEARNQTSESLLSLDQLEHLVDFAEWMLERAAGIWNSASPANRKRLQEALFPNGLTVSEDGFGTAQHPLFFMPIQEIPIEESSLASPGGFEPPLPP